MITAQHVRVGDAKLITGFNLLGLYLIYASRKKVLVHDFSSLVFLGSAFSPIDFSYALLKDGECRYIDVEVSGINLKV